MWVAVDSEEQHCRHHVSDGVTIEMDLVDAVHVRDRACECLSEVFGEDDELDLELAESIISRHEKPLDIKLGHSEQPTIVVEDQLNRLLRELVFFHFLLIFQFLQCF